MINLQTNYYLNWNDRPEKLKNKIDNVFEDLSREKESNWGVYDGRSTYDMLSIREGRCIKAKILNSRKEQKEFFVLDIGAGNFQLSHAIVGYMNEQKDIPNDITIHVIGIRGEGGAETEKRVGKCMLYDLTAFKVENLFDTFLKRGFHLENKVDFAISRWCLRHLADPMGTFVQVYNLLRPWSGVFIFDGFFFLGKEEEFYGLTPGEANGAMIDLLVKTKAPFLMEKYSMQRSLNRFILQRPDDSPCQLYMSYLEHFESLKTARLEIPQVGSCCVTRFDKKDKIADNEYFIDPESNNYFYGDRKLYDWLRNNQIISSHLRLGEAKNDSTEERFKLHYAVKRGKLEMVKEFLDSGCDKDGSDKDGYTPLHLAMKYDRMEIFKFLLDAGANRTICSCNALDTCNEFDSDNVTLVREAEAKGYRNEYIALLKNTPSY